MLKKIITLSLCTCFVSLNSFAQSLPEVLAEAYKTNPILKSSKNVLKSVDEDVAIAKSGYRPTLDINGSLAYQSIDSDSYSEKVTGNDDSLEIVAKQSLFSGLSTYNSVKSAKFASKASTNDFYNTEQSLLFSASDAYLNVLKNQAVVKLQKNNEELLKKELDETLKRFEVGEVTRTDVSQAKASHAEAIADTIKAKGELDVVKAEYERVVGFEPQTLEEPTFISALTPASLDDALLFAKENNFYIRQAKNNYLSKSYNVASNAGALLPSLSLEASANRVNSGTNVGYDGDIRTDSLEVGLNLNVPIYDAGLNRATLRQSKYKKAAAADDIIVATRQAVADTISAFEVMNSSKAQLEAIDAQIEANRLALDGVQKEEELGNRTLLNVLDAYQDLLNSEVSKEIAKEEYYSSALDLLVSMGKLTASDLQLDVDVYNPGESYKKTQNKWISTSVNKD